MEISADDRPTAAVFAGTSATAVDTAVGEGKAGKAKTAVTARQGTPAVAGVLATPGGGSAPASDCRDRRAGAGAQEGGHGCPSMEARSGGGGGVVVKKTGVVWREAEESQSQGPAGPAAAAAVDADSGEGGGNGGATGGGVGDRGARATGGPAKAGSAGGGMRERLKVPVS